MKRKKTIRWNETFKVLMWVSLPEYDKLVGAIKKFNPDVYSHREGSTPGFNIVFTTDLKTIGDIYNTLTKVEL